MSDKTKLVELTGNRFVAGQLKEKGQVVKLSHQDAEYFISAGLAVATKATKETAAPKAPAKAKGK